MSCKLCKFKKVAYILSWPVSYAQDCLQAFTEREALGEDAGFKCSACKRVQPATKQLTLRRCPPVLVLTLKRFLVRPAATAYCLFSTLACKHVICILLHCQC
jgi:ubiquitin C-terminal hydrolase